MSKKKATMTLKDFHGGSIPSDVLLPSAPGVTVRPVDRSGFDRQMPWGNSVGRPDQRLRPGSSGSAKNLDEKTPFLTNSSSIGRNFDEDERKPLDSALGYRRKATDEPNRSQPSRVGEPKSGNISSVRAGSISASVPVSQVSIGSSSSPYATKTGEVQNATLNNQSGGGSHSYGPRYPNMGGNAAQAVSRTHPNPWGIKKETVSMKELTSTPWSAPDAAIKLAHASALEKVSSGRWTSKQNAHSLKDGVAVQHPGPEGQFHHISATMYTSKSSNRLDIVGDTDYNDVAMMIHAERSLSVNDGIKSIGHGIPNYEGGGSTSHMDSYDWHASVMNDDFQLHQSNVKSSVMENNTLPSELSERPKLKLLPRSRPLEPFEPSIDYKVGREQTIDHLPVEESYVVRQQKNTVQSDYAGQVVADRAIDRPKLNLKPRSQPLEHFEVNNEVKRGTVFGGARPREVVLKERGIEDDSSNYESQSPLRVKEATPKADAFVQFHPARYGEKTGSFPPDQRITTHPDRRNQPAAGDRIDPLRRNKQAEIRRNGRDGEKPRTQHLKPQQDRPPSPETWRKPVEQTEPAPPPVRYGKAVSAVELAQAFSRSVVDPTVGDKFSGHRSVPNKSQVPFSRLTGPSPSPRPQINGY